MRLLCCCDNFTESWLNRVVNLSRVEKWPHYAVFQTSNSSLKENLHSFVGLLISNKWRGLLPWLVFGGSLSCFTSGQVLFLPLFLSTFGSTRYISFLIGWIAPSFAWWSVSCGGRGLLSCFVLGEYLRRYISGFTMVVGMLLLIVNDCQTNVNDY